MGSLIFKECVNKDRWCNGKHIPAHKKTKKTNLKGYPQYSDIDTSDMADKEPCQYFINKKCIHPQNPKSHKQHT